MNWILHTFGALNYDVFMSQHGAQWMMIIDECNSAQRTPDCPFICMDQYLHM